jgi:BirA family transcriptional regulator, biotin operon repressor / biotin---[acetyl-CoA-carboxylase] ligase
LLRTVPGTTDRRIDALLALLAENSVMVISGAKMASEIGVTRSTVWRWVEKLRSLGVKVKGHPRSGYQVERLPDVLVPQLLRSGLHGTMFGKRIHHFFKTDSTNTVAIRLGQEDEPHGALVIAEEQTAGRGRAGRSWLSEKTSGIYASVLLRPAISPMQAPLLTLLAGLAVRDAVAEHIGLTADIRWPNDLLLGGKKFCGILTEMHAEPDRVHYVVIGIGLNVNHTRLPAEIEKLGTSLQLESGRAQSRLELLIRLLRHLDRYYNQFVREGAAPLLVRFALVSSYAQGKRVRVTTATETFTGTTAGLDSGGLLRVARDDGRVEPVIAGDVSEAS